MEDGQNHSIQIRRYLYCALTFILLLVKLLVEKSTHFLVSKKTARVHLNEHIWM